MPIAATVTSATAQAAIFDDIPIRCSWLAPPEGAAQPSTPGATSHRGSRSQSAATFFRRQDAPSGRPAAALQPDLDPFGCHLDMLGDDGQDVLAQHGDQPRLAGGAALMGQQDLEALARQRRGAAPGEELKQLHAALLPNSLVSKGCRAFGM